MKAQPFAALSRQNAAASFLHSFTGTIMKNHLSPPPVLLMAGARERFFARALEDFGYVVVRTPTAAMSLEFARVMKPDIILIEHDSVDVPAAELCVRLRHDIEVPADTPVLIVLDGTPTADLRVEGLRAGAWDYLRTSDPVDEVALRIETYVQAKRSAQAVADGVMGGAGGVLTRAGLTRRLRELGALMVRMRGGLTCAVFAFDGGPADGTEARVIAGAARASDAIGALSHTDVAVVAPGTTDSGAVPFICRMADALRAAGAGNPVFANVQMRAGYAAVGNLKYSPANPMELLSRAALALQSGECDPAHPWIRRLVEPLREESSRSMAAAGAPAPSLTGTGATPSHDRRTHS